MAKKPDDRVVSLLHFVLALLALIAMEAPARAALLGNNFVIAGAGGRFPDVAFGSVDSKYLVVWPDYGAQRRSAASVTARAQ